MTLMSIKPLIVSHNPPIEVNISHKATLISKLMMFYTFFNAIILFVSITTSKLVTPWLYTVELSKNSPFFAFPLIIASRLQCVYVLFRLYFI